ncbi:MAG TPA: response regulator [Clostridiaceae bacterium]|jgi:DNA-binding NtrC family response regulator|nr:response regulator [Clostridiaceae bacterium]
MQKRSAIVCVDDDEMILISLKQELIAHFNGRYRYESALNAEEALDLIDELVADKIYIILVITDWLMPGMNGDEFLMKVHEKYPEIQTLVITGYADILAVSKARQRINLSGVITKPWNSDELIQKIETVIGS